MDTPFRLRLNCLDHYQAKPLDFDPQIPKAQAGLAQTERPRVPVIRAFGATETGQKVCAHIHGAFPYLYIPYNGDLSPRNVETYISQVHLSIDHALAVSYRRNIYDGKSQYVAHITLVKGVPFYGYHVGYQVFLKVYVLNPLHMTRLADLLRQGAIMKQIMQPHESHMQYLAQWMCDYNLYGCAYIDCKTVKFRWPVPDYFSISTDVHQWHDRTIGPERISDRDAIPRQSHCSLEVDLCVQDIINRLDVKPRQIHHDFIERGIPDQSEKLVNSMAGLWRDETRRRKLRMGLGDSDSSPFPPEVLVSVSADPRNSQPGGWIHEEEFRERIRVLIQEEEKKRDPRAMDFETFVSPFSGESQIKTTLESIEDLYPSTLYHADMLSQQLRDGHDRVPDLAPEVDENRVLSYEEEDFPYEGSDDEELNKQQLHLSQRKDQEDQLQQNFMSADRHNGNAHRVEQHSDRTRHMSSETTTNHHSRSDAANSAEQGPVSSEELSKAGIHDAGDYTHADRDAFQIPPEFCSERTVMINNRNINIANGHKPSPEPPRKKMRFSLQQDTPKVGMETDKAAIQYQQDQGLIEGKIKVNVSPEPIHSKGKTRQQEGILSSTNDAISPKPVQSSPSQERPHSENSGRLPFPIVKDPHDPNTLLRLSQSQSQKSKQHKNLDSSPSATTHRIPSSSSHLTLSGSVPVSSTQRYGVESDRQSSAPQASGAAQCALHFREAFPILQSSRMWFYSKCSPPGLEIQADKLRDPCIASEIHQDAYYSNETDVPERSREYAGKEFRLESLTVPYLPDFDPTGSSLASLGQKPNIVIDQASLGRTYQRRKWTCSHRVWEIARPPPAFVEVERWVIEENENDSAHNIPGKKGEPHELHGLMQEGFSQIEAATQKNRHGFKYSQKQKSTSVQHETQYMSIMSLEVHVNTRGSLLPNPEHDEICSVFWCIQSDDEDLPVNGINEGTHVGIVVNSEKDGLAEKVSKMAPVDVDHESSELDVINRMVDIVRAYDPDILTGYEVHGSSWGYLIERARHKYDYNLCDEFSRMLSQSHGRFGKEEDRWGFNMTSTIRVTGRHMINIWRAMRGELNLLQYTMENVVYQVCHKRIPHYNFQDLTSWYSSHKPRDTAKVINYYLNRVQLDLEILEKNELVPRTSEQARLLGVDFFSVFSRGSQFKVESLMFRIAKPENLLLPSPSRKQVGQQNALECLPLVMEPQSAFYNSPMLVLDFQSLYPSIMIAYNYCYSTFLGRIVSWRGQNKMGFTDYHRKSGLLELLKDHINIAPNGMMYARPEIRKSLLAKMLGEILETRVMVKSGMKVDKDDKTLQRLLNNRQLALKLIANVTYGYTSASFSGRMPCSEIADSIVQTARETLEKAIALIHSVPRWNAEVVYGDTDSLFVYLKGRTKDEAFDIGQQIADAITNMNPRPVKLKFEKVYLPCVLLAKKRYVGFKYESKNQKTPEFDAKGIETVRRDGTPAEQKIEEKALKILFRTADLSQVKSYFQRQCIKIMRGKVSIQDFCFAKEVKLGTYSDKGLPPPGALISTRRMLEDPRAEPQYGERVPYVVVTGAPGARLIDRCVAPDVLLYGDENELDAEYYISKNLIPPLERIFNLMGANVRQWFDEMPKIQRMRRIDAPSLAGDKDPNISKRTLESYMRSSTCLICRDKIDGGTVMCARCIRNPATSILRLQSRLSGMEKKASGLERICRSCSELAWDDTVKCDSKDCPIFYTRMRHTATSRSERRALLPAIALINDGVNVKDFEW